MGLEAIILAAGQGTRMRSKQAKVLHTLAGQPLLTRLAETTASLNPKALHVVVGHQAGKVSAAVAHLDAQCHFQAQQKGTGHAFGIAHQHKSYCFYCSLVCIGIQLLRKHPQLHRVFSQKRVLCSENKSPVPKNSISYSCNQRFIPTLFFVVDSQQVTS